jgi:hypothetical protein
MPILRRSGTPLQLVWVGLSGGCKDKRLNSHSLLAGTEMAVGLEQIDSSSTLPTQPRVYFFKRVEPLLQRLLPHKPHFYESLPLKPIKGSDYVGWAQTLTLPDPGIKGTTTVICSMSTRGRDPAPHVISVTNGVIHIEDTKGRPEVDFHLISIFRIKLGGVRIKPRSKKVLTYEVSAPLDPEVEFDVLLPGREPDLNDYLRHYIAEVAPILGVSYEELDEELQRTYGPALTPSVGEHFRCSVTPPTLSLDDGGSAIVELTVANDSASRLPALLALRAKNQETEVISVSDLVAINMPLLAVGRLPGETGSPAQTSAGQPHAGAS